MTSTNEFVPVMKQNVPVIVPDCKNIGYKICNGQIIKYMEITAWLVSMYDFNAQVVKDCKRTSVRSKQVSLGIFHNKCVMKIVQTNQPSNQVSYQFLRHFNFFRGSTKNFPQTRK
jgi:hypothetical protein